jgi:hypothetical protein
MAAVALFRQQPAAGLKAQGLIFHDVLFVVLTDGHGAAPGKWA